MTDGEGKMDQRRSLRFDKAFPVWVESVSFGESQGIARNISAGGIFVEMHEPLPLGSEVKVHFSIPEGHGELVACGEVKRHYFFQFSDESGARALTGMGVRFTSFEEDGEAQLDRDLKLIRTLH